MTASPVAGSRISLMAPIDAASTREDPFRGWMPSGRVSEFITRKRAVGRGVDGLRPGEVDGAVLAGDQEPRGPEGHVGSRHPIDPAEALVPPRSRGRRREGSAGRSPRSTRRPAAAPRPGTAGAGPRRPRRGPAGPGRAAPPTGAAAPPGRAATGPRAPSGCGPGRGPPPGSAVARPGAASPGSGARRCRRPRSTAPGRSVRRSTGRPSHRGGGRRFRRRPPSAASRLASGRAPAECHSTMSRPSGLSRKRRKCTNAASAVRGGQRTVAKASSPRPAASGLTMTASPRRRVADRASVSRPLAGSSGSS